MLSPDDARVWAADPAVPGLSTALDDEVLTAWAAAGWPALGVRGASLEYVRYKPSTNCLASGTLATAQGPVIFTVKAYAQGELAPLDKARRWSERRADRRGALVNAQRAVVLTTFPYDAKIRALSGLEEARLPRLVRSMDPRRRPVGPCSLRLLSYRPERRVVALVEHGAGVQTLRAYSPAEFVQRAARLHHWQRHRLPHVDGQPSLHPARPIVGVPWLAGESFDRRLATATVAEADAVGHALAALHGAPATGLPALGVTGERRRVMAAAEALVPLVPEAGTRVRAIAHRLAGLLPSSTRLSLCHGDLAARQVIVTEAGARFVDLDELIAADPRVDLGSFLADLDFLALRGDLATGQAARMADAFLEGYRSLAPIPDGVDAARAAALLALAPLPFRRRQAQWRDRTQAVLEAVERRVCSTEVQGPRAMRRRAASVAVPGGSTPGDPALPWLDRALDPVAAREDFASIPALDSGFGLVGATLVRHKPGRRAVIRYQFQNGPATLYAIGKMHRRGVDRRSAATQRTLRDAGFTERHQSGIAAPEVLGVVPELGLWLQAAVEGSRATALLSLPKAPTVAERIADIAVAVAERGPTVERTWSLDDEMALLDTRLALLSARQPWIAHRLTRVAEGCRRLAGTIAPDRLVPAHRDFYPDQVLLAGSRAYLVDLDLFSLAPPGLDLGNCLAHILERAVRDASTHPDAALAFAARATRCLPAVRGALEAWTTLSLARLVEIADRMPERAAFVEPLLSLVEERLSDAVSLPRPSTVTCRAPASKEAHA